MDNISPNASGANKTTSGNDTIEGTGTTLTALDTIDGGAGYDTLVIRDAAGVMGTTAPAGMTIAVEKIDINTAGALGQVTAASQAAQKEIDTVTFTTINDAADATVTYNVVWNGVTVTTAPRDNTATAAEAGTLVANAINAIAGSTVAAVVGSQVVITAPVAGTALPTYSITSSDVADVITIADSQANQAAVAGSTVAVYDFSGVTGLETVVAKAAGNVNVKLADTTDASITTTTGSVTVAGGKAVTTSGATGAVSVTGAAGLTSVDVTGATTVAIADNGTEADTLATVSISGATGASTVASDALTKLTVANSNQNVTVTAAAATRALDLTVNKLTGGTIQDVEATSLALTSTGTASTGVTVSTAKAATISVAGDKAVSFALDGTGASQAANLAITVTNTAGATITTQLDNDVSFTGGAGNDVVTIGATTKAINMGEGNNTVNIAAGVTAVGTGGSIAAGAGTEDTLSMAAADAGTATADATAKAAFAAKISGFERLTLGDDAAGATVKLDNLNNINYVSVGDVANTKTLTLSGVASGFTLNANSGTTGNGAVAVALATDGAVGVVDVLNVGISNSTAKDLQALTANKFETINFTSDDTATTPAGGFLHVVSALSADAVKTINVTGDAGFNLGYTGTTATTIDASGITKGGFTWTAGALAASSVVKGSATGTNTISLDSATTASTFVTYTGGSGDDVIVSTNNNNNVFTLGNGANSINTGAAAGNGNNTVTGGSGVDTIKLGNGNNTIDVGAGNNVVIVGNGNNTITATTGQQDITVGTGQNVITIAVDTGDADIITVAAPTTANTYSTITGLTAGDKLNFADQGTEVWLGSTATTAKISLNPGTALFADYISAATSGNATAGAHGVFSWFQFGGDTYVVQDNSDADGYVNNADIVVKLTGLVDLATSTLGDHVITLA